MKNMEKGGEREELARNRERERSEEMVSLVCIRFWDHYINREIRIP